MDRLTAHLLAARDGEDDALATAIRVAQPDVRRFLRPLVDRDDLDDVTQDTFVRAYRALPRYRGEASGRTWLLSIARRAAADATRRRIRRRRGDERLARSQPEIGGPEHSGENGYALFDLISHLDENRRVAFVLTQVIGCEYAEAAEICAVPIGTIRSRVARAREQLLEEVRTAQTA